MNYPYKIVHLPDTDSIKGGPVYTILLKTTEQSELIVSLSLSEARGLANAARQKYLREGATVINPDGSRTWRERLVEFDTTLPDSLPFHAGLTWHADRKRVRCQWVEVTTNLDGTKTDRPLRRVWVRWDKAF